MALAVPAPSPPAEQTGGGSAIAKIVGRNVLQHSCFHKEVRMWVFEEIVQGERLTEIINKTHENVKYLPNVRLPDNVVAMPELLKTVEGATLLIFVIPHQASLFQSKNLLVHKICHQPSNTFTLCQLLCAPFSPKANSADVWLCFLLHCCGVHQSIQFVKGVCEQLKNKTERGARAISLIKGVDAGGASGLNLISDVIKESLQIDVSVLMGANIASEVAQEKFCESTIGYSLKENADIFKKVFNTPYFRVSAVQDVAGVELCGALKNVVAIAAGLVDGLKSGENTKAAIIRIGLMEMKKFAKAFYDGIRDDTFFESCGIADVITTCFGGRNRRIAEARVLTGKSFEVLEAEMLNGQKLQGSLTAKEIHDILVVRHMVNEFPLFTTVYRICYEGLPPQAILEEI
eukprot:jgi/Hompol1/6171/HPOL_004857-RA